MRGTPEHKETKRGVALGNKSSDLQFKLSMANEFNKLLDRKLQ